MSEQTPDKQCWDYAGTIYNTVLWDIQERALYGGNLAEVQERNMSQATITGPGPTSGFLQVDTVPIGISGSSIDWTKLQAIPTPPTKLPNRFCFVDLETTGLSILKHGIIQIGAYCTGEREQDFVGYFVSDADPSTDENPISKQLDNGDAFIQARRNEIFDRTSIALSLQTVLKDFKSWLKCMAQDHTLILVFHGAKFDVPRLEVAYERIGESFDGYSRRVLCTVTKGFEHFGETLSLHNLSERLGISNAKEHDALADAITTSKCYFELERRKRIPPYVFGNTSWHNVNRHDTGSQIYGADNA